MRATTLEGAEIDLTPDMLTGLKMQLQGPLLTPDDADYEASRSLWNAMIDRRPAVVVRCLGVADVMAR